jgi:hypothetical protein
MDKLRLLVRTQANPTQIIASMIADRIADEVMDGLLFGNQRKGLDGLLSVPQLPDTLKTSKPKHSGFGQRVMRAAKQAVKD